MMNTKTIDTEQIKNNTDLRELAASYTTLHRESARELAGPCPKCGGDDRFHVTAETFFCRHCRPPKKGQRSDCIAFIQWMHGAPFKEAAAMLTGGAMPAPATPRKPEAKRATAMAREWDAARAAQELERYQSALWDEATTAAHDYLDRRGLDANTWLLFGLGYRHDMSLPNTWDASTRSYCHPPQPAIVIPWYRGDKLVALRYRFLQPHTYTGQGEEKPRTEKQTSRGNFAGHIFGGHALRRHGIGAPDERTLIITEGELNAMSLFQVARDTGLDVLSLGGESQKLAPETIAYAQRYRRLMVWTDREEIAEQLQAAIPGAFAVTSEMCGGKDANDLLQAHHLGGYLSAWRFQMCDTPADRAALYGDLRAGANTWAGLDAGSVSVMEAITR